jgi:hypothetical protein
VSYHGKEVGRSGERGALHDPERGKREGGGVEDVKHLGITAEVNTEAVRNSIHVEADPWQQVRPKRKLARSRAAQGWSLPRRLCYPQSPTYTRLHAQWPPCCFMALTRCPDELHGRQRSASGTDIHIHHLLEEMCRQRELTSTRKR